MKPRLLFGGSFDPPHQGHMSIADLAAQHHGVSSVTFIPNYVSPFKEKSISAEHRLRMLQLCVKKPHEIWDFEINKEEASFTVDTLKYLKKRETKPLVWIVGADCLNHLHLWKDISQLLELTRFQLITRSGVELQLPEKLKSLMGDKADHFLAGVLTLNQPYSSTHIRQSLLRSEKPEGLEDDVFRYIQENKLYVP